MSKNKLGAQGIVKTADLWSQAFGAPVQNTNYPTADQMRAFTGQQAPQFTASRVPQPQPATPQINWTGPTSFAPTQSDTPIGQFNPGALFQALQEGPANSLDGTMHDVFAPLRTPATMTAWEASKFAPVVGALPAWADAAASAERGNYGRAAAEGSLGALTLLGLGPLVRGGAKGGMLGARALPSLARLGEQAAVRAAPVVSQVGARVPNFISRTAPRLGNALGTTAGQVGLMEASRALENTEPLGGFMGPPAPTQTESPVVGSEGFNIGQWVNENPLVALLAAGVPLAAILSMFL